MARRSASSTAALAAWGAVGRGRALSAHRVAVVADDRGARHEPEFGSVIANALRLRWS